MDYGKKISQAGYDVKSCLDKQLILSSEFNSLKISKEGATTLAVNNGATQTKTIAHGLSYTPSHYIFVEELTYGGNNYWLCDGGGGYAMPLYDPSKASGDGTFHSDSSYFSVYADATNVYITINNFSGINKTYNIYYFILIEDNG